MTGNEYQDLARRTSGAKGLSLDQQLTVAALGLAGETGELVDEIKKVLFHGHDFNQVALVKELGDVLWYVAEMATALGIGLDEVMEMNIEKLKARYPEGFSVEASLRRAEGDE